MGVVAGTRQIIGAVVAHGGAGAGAACQQAALGAVAALHHTGRGRECLIRQVCLHLFHQGLPRHNTGTGLGLLLTQRLGHIIGCIVAPPHGGNVVRRAAHEPQILFVAGGTGLAKGFHAVGVGITAAGGTHAGVQHVLQQAVHHISGIRGQGLIAGGVVLQIDIAVTVQHAGIQVRGGVLAIVEDLERSCQRRGRNAMGLTAHDHLRQTHIVYRVQRVQLQGVVHKIEDVACAHQITHTHRNGVQRAGQTVPQRHITVVAVVAAIVAGPAAPCVGISAQLLVGKAHQAVLAAVILIADHHILLLIQGRVVEHGGPVHQTILYTQCIRTDRLDGRTRLTSDTVGTVQREALVLFAQTTHNGDHIAVIVQRDHGCLSTHIAVIVNGTVVAGAGLGRTVLVHHLYIVVRDGGHLFLMPAGREVGIVRVEHQVFHGGLHLGVHSRLNGKAAGVQQLLCLGFRNVFLVHDVLHQLGEQCIGKVRGNGRILLGILFLGQYQRLGRCVAVVLFADHALLPHVVHEEVTAVDQVFGVGVGVIVGGVFGDGRNGRTLPQGQLADILIKVFVGRSLHALNGAGKADGVQVRFQNGLLGIAAAQTEGAVDLAQLAQCAFNAAGALVVGQVLDQLLLQRGCTLLGAVDGQQVFVDHCADGALEVDAGLVVKVLILGADERILQVRGDLLQIRPHAVAVGRAQRGILHLCTGVRVGSHHHTGLAQLNVVQIQQVAVVGGSLHHVIYSTHCHQTACHDAQTNQCSNGSANEAQNGMSALFMGFLWFFGFPAAFGSRLGLPAAVTHIYLPPRRCRGMSLTGTVDLSHIGDRNRLLTFRLLFQRHALVLFHQSAQNCTQYHIIARAQNAGKNQSSALIGLIICSITQSAGQSTAFPCEN